MSRSRISSNDWDAAQRTLSPTRPPTSRRWRETGGGTKGRRISREEMLGTRQRQHRTRQPQQQMMNLGGTGTRHLRLRSEDEGGHRRSGSRACELRCVVDGWEPRQRWSRIVAEPCVLKGSEPSRRGGAPRGGRRICFVPRGEHQQRARTRDAVRRWRTQFFPLKRCTTLFSFLIWERNSWKLERPQVPRYVHAAKLLTADAHCTCPHRAVLG